MSPQKRRPQPRKGRTAVAAHKSKKGSDRTLTFVGISALVLKSRTISVVPRGRVRTKLAP